MRNDDKIVVVGEDQKRITTILVVVILSAVFMLGWLFSSKKEGVVTFSYEEIQMIERFQEQVINEVGPKGEVVVYKDRKGNLKLGWDS